MYLINRVSQQMLLGLLSRKKKEPTVRFEAKSGYMESIAHPTRASKIMPEWFKNVKPVPDGHTISASTIKRCVPFREALTHGYIIPLWADLVVSVQYEVCLYDDDGNEFGKTVFTGNEQELVGNQPDGTRIAAVKRDTELSLRFRLAHQTIFKPDGETTSPFSSHDWGQIGESCPLKNYRFGKTLMKFENPWAIKTKKGWSCYIKAPAGHFGQQIEILEGVVDSDAYQLPISFPFVWKGDKQGDYFIPKGTPLIQVIPFKRHETTFEVGEANELEQQILATKLNSRFIDRYKSTFWHKRKGEG